MGGKQDGMGRRLSKPRTNNNSSSNLLNYSDPPLESSSPFTNSDMDYFGDATVVTSQGERRSRRKSRSKIRAYLYGSHSESSQTLSSDEDDQSPSKRLSGAASGAKKRLSRTGSAFIQLSNAKSSTSQLSFPSNSNLLLAHDSEESVMVAEQIKEKAHTDSLAAHNHVSSPVDEDKHVDSIFAPVRRKSLYTPGIATRNASDILRKPPPAREPQALLSEADRNYYYNPAHPETSPLGRLAALNISEDGRSTPSNLNIPHLGGLQLGTLRVTNGAASPVPQVADAMSLCLSRTLSSSAHDDFKTASEGSFDDGRMTPRSPVRLRSSTIQSPSNVSVPMLHSQPEEWNEEAFVDRSSSVNSGPQPPGCSSAMANAYMAELGGSPFSRSPLAEKPTNQICYDEAIDVPESDWVKMAEAHNFAQDSREDAFERLNGTLLSPSQPQRLSVPCESSSNYENTPDAVANSDSGYNSHESLDVNKSPALEYETDRFEEPIHAGDDTKVGARPTLRPSFINIPKYALEGAEPRVYSTSALGTIKTFRHSDRLNSRNPMRKLRKSRPKSQPPPLSTNLNSEVIDLAESNIPRVPSLMAAKHAERLNRFPLLEHTFPSAAHVSSRDSPSPLDVPVVPVRFPSPAHALEAVSTSTSMNSALYECKSNQFSSQMASPISQGYETSDIIRSPSWSNFGRSRKKKDQKKLVKRAEEERRRQEKEEKELTKRLEQDRKDAEKHLKKDERKERWSRSRTPSRARNKSSERRMSQDEANATIADFGSVSACLGGSPYDIATSIHPNAGRDASGSHPHQMSSVMQRPRSLAGMDDMTSSDTKRSRSRASIRSPVSEQPETFPERKPRVQTMICDAPPLPALSASDIRSHGLERARNGQRSRSYSTHSGPQSEPEYMQPGHFNDRGGVPGKMLRPQSMMLAAPPVPALPSLQRSEQQEVKANRSRPRSMVIDPSSDSDVITIDLNKTPRNEPRTLVLRQARSSRLVVPDLLSNGSLEKRSPKQEIADPLANASAIDDSAQSSDNSSMWEAHRQAWSQRRKSAGEALMNQNRNNRLFVDPAGLEGPASPRHSQAAPLHTELLEQPIAQTPSELHNPSERRQLTQSTSYRSISRKPIGSGPPSSAENTSTVTRLTGRYEGGLLYGYEPGCGLGGSAGTRGAKTEASRKSVDVSRGFGLDLSDVPVFVAATSK